MSNSLRQRLGSAPEPHLHPDADLLTAYAERSLSPVEQADMVRHLASCSYCREVVALSLPEIQLQPAAASVPRRNLLWVPMLRWAAVAATVVVGASLVIEKPWKASVFVPGPAKNESVAVKDSKQVPAVTSPAETKPAAVPSSQGSQASSQPAAKSEPAGRHDLAAGQTNSPSTHAFAGPAAETRNSFQRNNFQRNNAGGPSRGIPGANDNDAFAYSVNSAAGTIAPPPSLAVTASGADLVSAPVPKPAVMGQASETGFVVRQIPSMPITADSIGNSRFAVTLDNEKKDPASKATSADTFSTARIFKVPARVFSAGKEKLAGAMTSRPGAGLAMMEKAPAAQFAPAEHVHWSISPEGKLIKSSDLSMWHEAYPQKDNLLFKVVVAEGHDVWAGGNHMTLIHSWNGGVDWKKLKLGDTATGDITDIQIGDGDVQVKTSNNQTFVSQDGGVTWVPLQQQPK